MTESSFLVVSRELSTSKESKQRDMVRSTAATASHLVSHTVFGQAIPANLSRIMTGFDSIYEHGAIVFGPSDPLSAKTALWEGHRTDWIEEVDILYTHCKLECLKKTSKF